MAMSGGGNLNISWVATVLLSVAYLLGLPFFAHLVATAYLRYIRQEEPWIKGKAFIFLPILSFKFPIDERKVGVDARKASAVSRFYGASIGVPQAKFRSELANSVRLIESLDLAAITSWVIFYLAGAFGGLYLWPDISLKKVDASWNLLYEISRSAAVFFAGAVACRKAFFASKKWPYIYSDYYVIRSCALALEECHACTRGNSTILAVEKAVGRLSSDLGDFANAGGRFSDRQKSENLSRHVAQVQDELRRVTDVLLKEGSAGLSGVVECLSTLASRACEQRWFCLLDLPEPGDEGSPASTRSSQDRRDAWIVVGGAVAAAALLGVSSVAGLPFTATGPAALVLAIAPAVAWGSNSLKVSPAGLLRSVSSSIASSSQGGEPSGSDADAGGTVSSS
ncbi:hypothetical protein [Streptomyces sp. NPDC058954]|uniref:hypothetical protein n=1 Tax=Streptomyces sp. NPDC058954 TaxID=3346677 RepID=UPI0036B4E1E3